MSIARLMQMGAAAPTGPEGAWDLSYAYYDPPASLAGNLSNASYTNDSFYIRTWDTYPVAGFFKPDGTKMYILGGDGVDVNEFNLSYPWDVSTASYVQNFSVSAQVSAPRGLFFKPDGTVMYVVETTGGDAVEQYSLSTAWDVSTASYVQGFSLSAQGTDAWNIFFKPDGTKMYIAEDSGNNVNEYDLSTAWDISTASYLQSFDVSGQESQVRGVSFLANGTKMYVVGFSGDDVNEYSLSTPWDVSTASYVQNFSVSAQDTAPSSVFFTPGGGSFYVVGLSLDYVFGYRVGGFSIAAQNGGPNDVHFSPDGTKMYVVGTSADEVNEYSLSTAWDISTASFVRLFSVLAQENSPEGIFFKPDGTKMYITGNSGDDVNEYSLSTAWNISTASFVQSFSVLAQEEAPRGVFFKPDGTKMYVTGFVSDAVNEYSLSTAWDVSTASYVQNFSVSTYTSAPHGISFKPDGTKMYVGCVDPEFVLEYNLSTPWDISTASYVQNFEFYELLAIPTGLFFKPDGTGFYTVSGITDSVYSFSVGVQE